MKTFIIFTPSGDKIISADSVERSFPMNTITLIKSHGETAEIIAAFNLDNIYGWSEGYND